MLKRLAVDAGIKKRIGFHAIKRGTGTHMVEKNASKYVIQLQLGHTKATNTNPYYEAARIGGVYRESMDILGTVKTHGKALCEDPDKIASDLERLRDRFLGGEISEEAYREVKAELLSLRPKHQRDKEEEPKIRASRRAIDDLYG